MGGSLSSRRENKKVEGDNTPIYQNFDEDHRIILCLPNETPDETRIIEKQKESGENIWKENETEQEIGLAVAVYREQEIEEPGEIEERILAKGIDIIRNGEKLAKLVVNLEEPASNVPRREKLPGQSYKIIQPLPETSEHFELSKKFVENMVQGENPDCKHLSDTVFFIETNEFTIGVGSNSTTVYIGYHHNFQAWVAIKRCLISEPAALQEIAFIKKQNFRNKHQNIGAFIDCIEEKRDVYLILELYEENLAQYFSRHNDVAFKTKCTFVFGLLQGIDFLHHQNIIHRDLKPQNLMIDNSGVLKIVDFGISREIDISKTQAPETSTHGTILWLPPSLLSSFGSRKVKVEKEEDIFVAVMLLFFVFSGGQHPFCDLNNWNLINYVKDIVSFNFFKSLKDPYLQSVVEEMFKRTQTRSIKEVSNITDKLNDTHRIREVDEQSSEIFERTPGKRYAILIACTNILKTAQADATVLKPALENCGFSVEARNNISKEQLLSSKIENDSDRVEPIALTLKRIQQDNAIKKNTKHTTQSEDIYIYLHVSTHGYHDESLDETFLQFDDKVASVKEITNKVFDIISLPKVHLIFTVETCQEDMTGTSCQLGFPNSPFVIFYSSKKGFPSGDSGGLPESFACPAPFSRGLEREIRPAMPLGRIFEKVKSGMKGTVPDEWLPEAEDANDTDIYNFVF